MSVVSSPRQGAYAVTFTSEGRETVEALEKVEREHVRQKLNEIGGDEFRDPWDWDFKRIPGRCDGRFKLSDGIRAYADIDRQQLVIRVHKIVRRENCY